MEKSKPVSNGLLFIKYNWVRSKTLSKSKQEFDMEEYSFHLLFKCSLFAQISWTFILLAVDGNVIHIGLIVVSE